MIQIPAHIEKMNAYKAGKTLEQLKHKFQDKKIVKLASNENPLGPSPKALETLKKLGSNLHRYPNPSGIDLRQTLAKHLGLNPETVSYTHLTLPTNREV